MSGDPAELLSSALAGFPGLVTAYHFGSSARGESSGDVDVAVLMKSPPDHEVIGALLAAIQDALGRDDVDLVILNSATPILAFEAISGRRIATADVEAAAAFESLTAREYEDEWARMQRAQRLAAKGPK